MTVQPEERPNDGEQEGDNEQASDGGTELTQGEPNTFEPEEDPDAETAGS